MQILQHKDQDANIWSWHVEECIRSRCDNDVHLPVKEIDHLGSLKKVALIAATVSMIAMGSAQAQMRIPLPGGYRLPPQMIMPAIRGASQLGWYGGSYLSQRQFGPSANPGPWPGLGSALGIRRR